MHSREAQGAKAAGVRRGPIKDKAGPFGALFRRTALGRQASRLLEVLAEF